MSLIIVAVVALLLLLLLGMGALFLFVPAVGAAIFFAVRGKSMVPRVVRKRFMKEMDNALADEQIDTLHRKLMKAKGWTLDES